MSEPTFTIKRKYLLGLGMWLQGLSLYGRESRERTKFVEQLAEEVKENEAMRLELVNKYSEKEEDGVTPKLTGEDDKKTYVIPEDKLPEFSKEVADYLDENFVMSIEGNKERLKKVKFIVLDTNEKIDPKIASDYDKWCEAFEALQD